MPNNAQLVRAEKLVKLLEKVPNREIAQYADAYLHYDGNTKGYFDHHQERNAKIFFLLMQVVLKGKIPASNSIFPTNLSLVINSLREKVRDKRSKQRGKARRTPNTAKIANEPHANPSLDIAREHIRNILGGKPVQKHVWTALRAALLPTAPEKYKWYRKILEDPEVKRALIEAEKKKRAQERLRKGEIDRTIDHITRESSSHEDRSYDFRTHRRKSGPRRH
ncbi:MAG: hypothetical protein AABY11_03390 [archaeon]